MSAKVTCPKKIQRREGIIGRRVHGTIGIEELDGKIVKYLPCTDEYEVLWDGSGGALGVAEGADKKGIKGSDRYRLEIVSKKAMLLLLHRGESPWKLRGAASPPDRPRLPPSVMMSLGSDQPTAAKLLAVYNRYVNHNVLPLSAIDESFTLLWKASVKIKPDANAVAERWQASAGQLIKTGVHESLNSVVQAAKSGRQVAAPQFLGKEFPVVGGKGIPRMIMAITGARRTIDPLSRPATPAAQARLNERQHFDAAAEAGFTDAGSLYAFLKERRTVADKGSLRVLSKDGQDNIECMPRVTHEDKLARATAVIKLNPNKFVPLDAIDKDSSAFMRNLKTSAEHSLNGSAVPDVDLDGEYGSELRDTGGFSGVAALKNFIGLGLTVSEGGRPPSVRFDRTAPASRAASEQSQSRKQKRLKVGQAVGKARAAEFERHVVALNKQGAFFFHFRGLEQKILLQLGVPPERIIDHGQSVCMIVGAKANGAGSPIELSMDNLAFLLGYTQTHSAVADCLTQHAVMDLLLEAYAELSE